MGVTPTIVDSPNTDLDRGALDGYMGLYSMNQL